MVPEFQFPVQGEVARIDISIYGDDHAYVSSRPDLVHPRRRRRRKRQAAAEAGRRQGSENAASSGSPDRIARVGGGTTIRCSGSGAPRVALVVTLLHLSFLISGVLHGRQPALDLGTLAKEGKLAGQPPRAREELVMD